TRSPSTEISTMSRTPRVAGGTRPDGAPTHPSRSAFAFAPRSEGRRRPSRSRSGRPRRRHRRLRRFRLRGSVRHLHFAGGRRAIPGLRRLEADQREQLHLDLARDVLVLLEEHARVFAALADALLPEAEPGAGLGDDVAVDGIVDQLALARDPFVVEDVELRLAERRGDLVLDYLHLGAVADRLLAFLERRDAADVEPHRRVELERAPPGGGLRRVVHHDAVREIGMVALDLEVEAMRAAGPGFHVLLRDPCWHGAQPATRCEARAVEMRIAQIRLPRIAPPLAGVKLVLHRGCT